MTATLTPLLRWRKLTSRLDPPRAGKDAAGSFEAELRYFTRTEVDTPHPVIVTIRDKRILLGSSYIPFISLLQGGGCS